eukprot:2118232-Pyramimonas_sp.AAC.1
MPQLRRPGSEVNLRDKTSHWLPLFVGRAHCYSRSSSGCFTGHWQTAWGRYWWARGSALEAILNN